MWRSVCNGLVFFQSALPSKGSTLTQVSSSPPKSNRPPSDCVAFVMFFQTIGTPL